MILIFFKSRNSTVNFSKWEDGLSWWSMSHLIFKFWRMSVRHCVVCQLMETVFCTSSFMALTSHVLLTNNTSYITFFGALWLFTTFSWWVIFINARRYFIAALERQIMYIRLIKNYHLRINLVRNMKCSFFSI